MPGKVKVKILSGRNLPVMDRSSDTTDAYVEVKLGNTTFKTDVCRKSLNPQWNSEWYRFELDDAELQDEPLQIRIMDHDTYSANDAIGKVYIDLNPLLLPQSAGLNSAKNSDSLSSITSSSGGSVMSGWFPVYDTMHGIRGEVNVIVKVDLFTDFNKFRQSSCGVQFFNSSVIPQGYTAQVIHGFVEELVVSDDPEYQWIEKIRTPRASNEARQTTFFKLSGEVQRKIGLKVLELGGNCVIGYHQVFDLEGESGIVVRGIGTAVTLARNLDQNQPPGAPPQINLPPYAAPAPSVHDDQRTPSFLTLPKLNLSRLSPTKNILHPLSRLSPRLKRKFNPDNPESTGKLKPKGSSPVDLRKQSSDSSEVKLDSDEPDFNYSMNILLQQEDGRKHSHSRKGRFMKAITSIPRSSRKIYKKFSSSDDNVSLASKISIETTEAMLSHVIEDGEDSVTVDDSFEISSSSSSTTSSSSYSSSTLPTFEPIIYNYEPVVDLSNIKYFPRRNSDFSDQVNLILSEKYPGDSLEQIDQKREQEEQKRRRREEEREKLIEEKTRFDYRVCEGTQRDNGDKGFAYRGNEDKSSTRGDKGFVSRENGAKGVARDIASNPSDSIEVKPECKPADLNQGSPKARKVSMFEGNLLEPNRDNASGRRYSDICQLSPQAPNQANMTRRHSSSDIGDHKISFESVYGRRLSDLPDLVMVKMSEKKRVPKNEEPKAKPAEKPANEVEKGITESKIEKVEATPTCSVEIKVDKVTTERNAKEENNNYVTQQITESFSFLDSRGTPPMSEMDRIEYSEDQKNSKDSKKGARPYLSNRNRIAYKETIFTPKMEMMLTVTEPSFDSSSSRQVSFDHDTSHDDLVLESSKEEIEFTGSHFLDLKPKLSKSYENLSSLNDEDLSPERSFTLANLSDEEDSKEKKNEDRSKKINVLESFPSPPVKTHYGDPVEVFGRTLEKLSEEGESKSPSLCEEDARVPSTLDKEPGGTYTEENTHNDSKDMNTQCVTDNGDTNTTTNGKNFPEQSSNSQGENTQSHQNNGFGHSYSGSQGNGGDDGDENPNRNHKPIPLDKPVDDEDKEEEEKEKTPPLSRMSPIVFGDEEPSNLVNFLSYNVTKSGGLIGVDRFNSSDSRFQMSLMRIDDVSRSNPNLSSDTKVRLAPRDKSRSMFDLVLVSNEPDRSSVKSRRSSVKKSKSFRRRESKSAENITRVASESKLTPKQPVLSDENIPKNVKSMEDIRNPPVSSFGRKDSVFARRKISLTKSDDMNRRESRSNGNLTESVENLASTLLTRRGSINLNRKNSITRKMSLSGNKPREERESYENVSGGVLMRRDSVKRFPDVKLNKQNLQGNELDRKHSQSSESITPYTFRRDPFEDRIMSRSCSVTSVSEYRETLRKLLKSQESIEEINETDSAVNRTNGDKHLESKSLVNITEQVEGDENKNKSESNIHKMIAVPKPTSILKNKIDFVPIPADTEKSKDNKDQNQNKAKSFFGEDIDLVSIESDAKSKPESSPANAPYSRIIANREDPLESRYSHIIANRIIVKPKQPPPDTKIQNGKDLHRRCPPTQHLRSNDYLVQKDFTAPVKLQNIDFINPRESSVDSSIYGNDSPVLKFTDFKTNDSVMKKLLSDSKTKAEKESNLVFGESSGIDEDLILAVSKFIDAEIKATLLQRCDEGDSPLTVSVPSGESKFIKLQNFTAKFIETEREVCATQRVEGHDRKKKSVLIIKSTEPKCSTIENTFIISTEPKDDAILTSKFIHKEKEHSTALRPRKSRTPEYVDTAIPKSSSQKSTADFIERERVFSAFQQPHLILCKKVGGKVSTPAPITDGLKTESKIKEDLERTSKFLQIERQFCAFQQQALVKLVRRSIDSIKLENEILKQALIFTEKFIEHERRSIARELTDPVDSNKLFKSQHDTKELMSTHKKKSPSKEKEKHSQGKKKCVPSQEEIDMIVKRQSYDFALSKMNMTGVIPNITAYKAPQPHKDSRSESSEPNYAYIISQSNLNYYTHQQDQIKQFKNERNRLSKEEVLVEECVKTSSDDPNKADSLSQMKPDEMENIQNIEEAAQSQNLEVKEDGASEHDPVTTPGSEDCVVKEDKSKGNEAPVLQSIESSSTEDSDLNKSFQKLTEPVPDTLPNETASSDNRNETCETFPGGKRSPCEDSIEESESTIVNFFSASRETVRSRLTGHSDDFSDFAESVESGLAEPCDSLPEPPEKHEPEESSIKLVGDASIQDTCHEEMKQVHAVDTQDTCHEEMKQVHAVDTQDTCHEEMKQVHAVDTQDTCHEEMKKVHAVDIQDTCHEEMKQVHAVDTQDTCHEEMKQVHVVDTQDTCHEEMKQVHAVDTQDTCHEEMKQVAADIVEQNIEETIEKSPQHVDQSGFSETCHPEPEQCDIESKPATEESKCVNLNKQSKEVVSNDSSNESVQGNTDVRDMENLSPKSSASEVLSDSAIDNQLNECRNCQHTKVDSLDFLSDEDWKSVNVLAREEGNLMEQLKELEAEKQKMHPHFQREEAAPQDETKFEVTPETCECDIEEQITLEHRNDDKSPDLVVTQGTSNVVDVTPVASPRTKKKKKKKQHASKEELNVLTEPASSTTEKIPKAQTEVQPDQVQNKSIENIIDKIEQDIKDTPVCDEHIQVNVDSQEDSDCKSKSKKKRKRRLTLNKTSKEESAPSSLVEQKEPEPENEEPSQKDIQEVDKPKPESENAPHETDSVETLPDPQKVGENKTGKKKKTKLTRHMTQAILDVMKTEVSDESKAVDIKCEDQTEACPEICEEIPTEYQQESCKTDETCETIPDDYPEVCRLDEECQISAQYQEDSCKIPEVSEETPHEYPEVCRLDEFCEEISDKYQEDFCRLDDICEEIPDGDNSTTRHKERETMPSHPEVYRLDNIDEEVSDKHSEDSSTLVKVCEVVPEEFRTNETPQGSSSSNANGTRDPTNQTPSPDSTSSQENRVDIHTGLDVINCRLDYINLEISTIVNVLSNINNELKHGSSTVVLDVPLNVSDRIVKPLHGVVGDTRSHSVGEQHRDVCCESSAFEVVSNGGNKSVKSEVVGKGVTFVEGSGDSVNTVKGPGASATIAVPTIAGSAIRVTNASRNLPGHLLATSFRVLEAPSNDPLTPLVCDNNPPSPSHCLVSVMPPKGTPGVEAPISGSTQDTSDGRQDSGNTPSKLGISTHITRRSSESDLSITPKGNSLAGSGGSSGGFGMRRGTVRANSVKLLERMTNLEEPESRDAWWTELRLEVRSHSRALACNVVLGYSEHTAICDDVCVLSASGTAAVVNVCLGSSMNSATTEITEKFTKLGQNGNLSESPQGNLTEHKIESVKPPALVRTRDTPERLEMPVLPCRFCHVPYNEASVPFKVNLLKCAVCKKGKVPDLIFATIDPPDNLPITGSTCFIQAFVSRSKRDCKGELNAKEISDGLPFLEYELHRQLMNKLHVKGMNALFGLKRTLAAYATATAVFLTPLPPPALPKVTAGDAWKDSNTIAEMQKLLQDCVNENKEFFRLRRFSEGDRLMISDSDDSEEEILPDIDLNAGGKDTCILEMDDAEDVSVVSQLIDPHPPRGFHVSSIETLPGLDHLEVVKNLQMFTQVWRSRVPSTTSVNKHFQRLLQTMYYKLRRMTPCAIAKLSFHIDIPEPEEVQLSVVGMALGLGEVDKTAKTYRRRLLSSHSKELTKDDGVTDLIFRLDEDQNETAPSPDLSAKSPDDKTRPLGHNRTPSESQDRGQERASSSEAPSGDSAEKSKASGLFTSHTPPKEHYGVDITPLSYIAGGKIERYLGNLNFFFIRESNCIRESGGLSGFVHSFVTEVLAILRAHVTALGGNAMVSYTMTHCILLNNQGKNQGQCLINVGGDVVFVSYPALSEDKE
ncbi:hypothetical protein M8J76_006565 [Diaphorina citri]|nr:hypothetical protein M8J76_006565 [Diaphorina citri]